jgi:peptidoglycan/LPS O-acetylase OafA/YrhL
LLITITLTKFKSKALHILLAYTAFCFVLNIIAVKVSAQFAFYFPFCRFWQMAVGGVLAFKPIKVTNSLYTNALSLIGLATILIGSYFLSEFYLYPGWWAILPTLASAAIILAGPDSFANKYFLGNKAMVFIGKISYSLYLWHWPLLVFSRSLFPIGTYLHDYIWFIVLLAFIFSIASYFLVENPIRFSKSKRVFFILLIVMSFIGVATFILYKKPELARPD